MNIEMMSTYICPPKDTLPTNILQKNLSFSLAPPQRVTHPMCLRSPSSFPLSFNTFSACLCCCFFYSQLIFFFVLLLFYFLFYFSNSFFWCKICIVFLFGQKGVTKPCDRVTAWPQWGHGYYYLVGQNVLWASCYP